MQQKNHLVKENVRNSKIYPVDNLEILISHIS